MKTAATNPPTSPTMPPPNAITSEPRSPPACTICLSRPLHAAQRLVLFAGRQKQRHRLFAERLQKCAAPQRPDLRRSDHKDPPRAPVGMRQAAGRALDARRQRLKQPAARENVVLCRWCLYSNGLHSLHDRRPCGLGRLLRSAAKHTRSTDRAEGGLSARPCRAAA